MFSLSYGLSGQAANAEGGLLLAGSAAQRHQQRFEAAWKAIRSVYRQNKAGLVISHYDCSSSHDKIFSCCEKGACPPREQSGECDQKVCKENCSQIEIINAEGTRRGSQTSGRS
jgi:hypothetical protein